MLQLLQAHARWLQERLYLPICPLHAVPWRNGACLPQPVVSLLYQESAGRHRAICKYHGPNITAALLTHARPVALLKKQGCCADLFAW